MRAVSVALAFQLVSVPVGTEEKEKQSVRERETDREGGREREGRKQNAEIQRISLERQRAQDARCVCVGSRANFRKAIALFASFHCTRFCLHALMIIGRRGPKTNQM
jgi:hypothetical protein